MPGSTFGTLFRITTWGESHGKGIGVVIDGCPAGLPLKAQDIQEYLNRRKPGQSRYTTQRSEPDRVEILSGVFEDRTTGTPISLLVYNKDQHSKDYSEIASCYRPGHADYTFDAKYGFRDYRGGGRSSGRETIGRVAGGAVAARLLSALGISFCTYTRAIGPVQIQNLPDFLDDEDVSISLNDPRLFVKVTNPTPVAINLTAQLTPVKDGTVLTDKTVQIGSETVAASQILIPANVTDYQICIHRTDSEEGIVADRIVSVPDLNNLIEQIPDEIRMEPVEAKAVQEFAEIDLGGDYYVETSYRLETPLQFNEGTEVIYSDQLDGWGGDMDDYDFKEAVVSLKSTNGIPLEMVMTVDAIDADGNVLSGVTATVEGNIAAGTPEQKTESELKITLKSSDTEALHRLDGLKYRVSAKTTAAVAGTTLNENQTLKLDDIRIQIKGGVTLDMN